MADQEKSLEQIQAESNESYKEFQKELKEAREYQSKNSVVKESLGGLSFNLGNNHYSSSSSKITKFSND